MGNVTGVQVCPLSPGKGVRKTRRIRTRPTATSSHASGAHDCELTSPPFPPEEASEQHRRLPQLPGCRPVAGILHPADLRRHPPSPVLLQLRASHGHVRAPRWHRAHRNLGPDYIVLTAYDARSSLRNRATCFAAKCAPGELSCASVRRSTSIRPVANSHTEALPSK